MRFGVIYADPPWDYKMWSEKGKTGPKNRDPSNHYPVLDIEELFRLPVAPLREKACVLLLWATWPFLEQALVLVKEWGFSYKTCLPWLKLSRSDLPKIGTGYHVRHCTEPLLICTYGDPPVPDPKKRREGVFFNEEEEECPGFYANRVGRHSAKPEGIYEFCESYRGPYLELFARPDGGLFPERDGWTRIGNEITGRDIREDLLLLREQRDERRFDASASEQEESAGNLGARSLVLL